MDDIISKLWEMGASVAMLGLAVVYFYRKDIAKDALIAAKDKEKDELHRELRVSLENSLNKSNDAISNNTLALTALRETLKR